MTWTSSVRRRRRTMRGSPPLLGRIASGACWRGGPPRGDTLTAIARRDRASGPSGGLLIR